MSAASRPRAGQTWELSWPLSRELFLVVSSAADAVDMLSLETGDLLLRYPASYLKPPHSAWKRFT